MQNLHYVLISLSAVCLPQAEPALSVELQFEVELASVNGSHLTLQMGWKQNLFCNARTIFMRDALGGHRKFDNPVQPLRVQSSESMPLVHWMEYTVEFHYECLLNHFTKYLTIRPLHGVPRTIRSVHISTDGTSATVTSTLPPELLSLKNYVIYVIGLLKREGDRACTSILSESKKPLVLEGLEPGIAYNIALRVKIHDFESDAIKFDFITGIPKDSVSRVDAIEVLSRTETTARLQWEYLKKPSLLPFITGFSIEWKSETDRGAHLYRAFTKEWNFTINHMMRDAEYIVSVYPYFRVGDTVKPGVAEYHRVEPYEPPDSSIAPSTMSVWATIAIAILAVAVVAFVLLLILVKTFQILRSKCWKRR